MAAICRAASAGEERLQVSGVLVPTLFLTGVDDHIPGQVAPLVDPLAGSRWVQVPGDHFTAPDNPEFLSTILEFLDEIER